MFHYWQKIPSSTSALSPLVAAFFCLCTPLQALPLKPSALTKMPALPSLKESECDIYLNNPRYHKSVLSTDEGGIISSSEIRIQAKKISYTALDSKAGKVQQLTAEEDLVVDFGGRILTGSHIDYDFIEKRGTIYNAVAAIDLWFISCEEIALNSDQSITIKNATISTSEDEATEEWNIKIKKLFANSEGFLQVKDLSFRIFKIPILWLPALKANLHLFTDPPVTYKITWDKGQGPRLTLRYRFYSSETWNLFFRVDGRTKRGFGGALEGDYLSLDKRTRFLTKNYLAHDTFYNDNDPNKKKTRFRLQGLHASETESHKWSSHLTWDKISDKNMPGDFKTDDFEINTARRTQWLVRNIDERHIAGLNVRARINSFQGFKQELPSLNLSLRSFELGETGIISENQTKTSYLDYVYSDDVDNLIRDFHSVRLETEHFLYRPIDLKIGQLSPYVGFNGIFYNNNPQNQCVGQAIFQYGGTLIFPFQRDFEERRHYLAPYVTFQGISHPTFSPNQVFIFDIQDGYNRLNMLRVGIKNRLTPVDRSPLTPSLSIDLYALGFFADPTFSKTFPKAYAEMAYHFARWALFADIGWNFQEQVLDRANLRFLWTLNTYFAFSFEYRHRSRFDWRKDDHDNYILDVTRPIDELLLSPLSDGRNTFLAKAQLLLAPGWTLRFQSHSGWGRAHQPGYTETSVDLLTMLSTAWRLRLSYMHSVRTDQVTFGLSLVPKP